MTNRLRLEWDGRCVCGKEEADGVRCRFGASHQPLIKRKRERERLPEPRKRERLDLFDDE